MASRDPFPKNTMYFAKESYGLFIWTICAVVIQPEQKSFPSTVQLQLDRGQIVGTYVTLIQSGTPQHLLHIYHYASLSLQCCISTRIALYMILLLAVKFYHFQSDFCYGKKLNSFSHKCMWSLHYAGLQ